MTRNFNVAEPPPAATKISFSYSTFRPLRGSLRPFRSRFFLHLLLFAIAALPFAACSRHDGHDHAAEDHSHEQEDASHDHDHNHDNGPTADDSSPLIEMTPEQAREAGVTTERVERGEFSDVIRVAGRVATTLSDRATLSATRSGIVRLTRPIAAGAAVGRGETLFRISDAGLPQGNLAAKARIAYEQAREGFTRVKSLYDAQLAGAAEYEAAKAAFEAARIEMESTGGESVAISSPKNGYILSCFVADGDYVEVGTPLMAISSLGRLQLTADLPMRYADRIADIRSARFSLSRSEYIYDLDELAGRIVADSKIAPADSPYLPLTFEFNNAPGIVAGSFAEVYLICGRREGVVAVAAESLTEQLGEHYVYLRIDDNHYRKRRVEIGASDGRRVEITSGLSGGEEIVVGGATAVRLASMSGSIPGHTHEH